MAKLKKGTQISGIKKGTDKKMIAMALRASQKK